MLCAGGGGCTWSGGMYLVPGGCTWSRGCVPGPEGGCTWSKRVYLVRLVYLVLGGVPSLGGCTWSWEVGVGVYLVLGGVPGPGGMYLVRGGGGVCLAGPRRMYLVRYSPPPLDRITDACKNITLPQLRCGR